jgi:MoxR-like ATPase
MDETEPAVLAEMIERLRAAREDRTRSDELARWADRMALASALDGSDVRDLAVEMACEWENIIVAAHEQGDPRDMPHEFPDDSLVDYLARAAAALSRAG